MSALDFNDPLIERKFIFQIAQKGCGIHPDRYFCYVRLGESQSVSSELYTLLVDLAKMHYEADFIVATTAEENLVEKDDQNDNIYLLDSLEADQDAFLSAKAASVLTDERLTKDGYDACKTYVVESLKRDNFKRDETTKQAIFKISRGKAPALK